MKIERLLFLFVMVIGCKNNVIQTNVANKDTTSYESRYLEIDGTVPYYQCDDYYAFKRDITPEYIDSVYAGFFKSSKEPVKNKQNEEITDTIISLFHDDNVIKIYHSGKDNFLALYDVTDPLFRLEGNIGTGITKETLQRKFRIKQEVKDTIDIGNMEQTFVIRFFFNHNKLKRIRTEPYLD